MICFRSLEKSSGPLLIGHPKKVRGVFFLPEMLNFIGNRQVENGVGWGE